MDVLANFVTVVHLAYFVFVVGGSCIVIVEAARRSGRWIFNPWFRIAHLLAVFVVLAEYVIGFNCPLNTLEGNLRTSSTNGPEASSGLGYVLDQLLHHTIAPWVLDAMYWTLGAVLLLLFFLVPPRFSRTRPSVR